MSVLLEKGENPHGAFTKGMTKVMKKSIYIKVISIFILIAALGFGVMNYFWATLPRNDNLYGLYHYRAASIGDGIFLPLLVSSLSFYILRNYHEHEIKIVKKRVLLNHLLAGLAGVIALLVQLQWLTNENIVLNWTIPIAGYFNIAGVYHAFFFVFMFYLITLLLTRVILIRNYLGVKCIDSCDMLSFFFIWLSGSGFLFMIGLDDLSNIFETDNLLLYIYITVIISFTILNFLSIKRIKYTDFVSVLSGCTSSLGIGLMSSGQTISIVNLLLIIALSLFSLSYIIIDTKMLRNSTVYSIITVFTVFFINFGIVSVRMIWIFVLISISVPALISLGQLFTQKNKKLILEFMVQGLILHILLLVSLVVYNYKYEDFDNWINLVVGIVVGTVLKTVIKKVFDFVKKQEKKRNLNIDDHQIFEILKHVKKLCYSSISLIVIGGLIYLFITLYNIAVDVSLNTLLEFDMSANNKTKLYAFLVILALSTMLLFYRKNIRYSNIKYHNLIFFSVECSVAYISLFFVIQFLRGPFVIDLHPTNIFLIFMSLGSALMIAESYYSNIIRIRGYSIDEYRFTLNFRKRKYDLWAVLSTFIIFWGNVFTIYVSLLPPSSDTTGRSVSLIYFLIGIVGCIYSTIFLPMLFAKTIKLHEVKGIPTTKIVEGVWQSGFLVTIIIILGGAITVYFKSIVVEEFEYWLGILMIISYVYWPLSFCLKNNVEHLKEQSIIYLSDKNNIMLKRQYEGLKFHIKSQNLITMIALLLYSLVPLIGHLLSCVFRGKTDDFLKDYWPKE